MQSVKEIALDDLFMRIDHPAFNYCKLKLIADIFAETGLAELEASSQRLKLRPVTVKADIEDAPTMKKLEALAGEQPA